LTILAQRAGPGHLKFPTPHEATPGGEWLRCSSPVRRSEYHLLGKDGCDALKPRPRQDGRAQVPHAAGEHVVERFALIGAEQLAAFRHSA
jgi:hypothetical protein